MRIAVAFDHRGIGLRASVIGELVSQGHEVLDLGTDSPSPQVDSPDTSYELAEALLDGRAQRGVLVGSSGVGVAIAANKISGIRAGLCQDPFTARRGVEDDAMNVLCLGAEVVGLALVPEIVRAFAEAEFAAGRRAVRRLDKLAALERGESLTEETRP